MNVIGSPTNWADLLEQMLPQLLRLTIDTWRALPGRLGSDREDDITNALCSALRANRTVRQLPFYVDTQMVELDPAAGQDLGRLDIAFRPTGLSGPPNESLYFCLECKRLNVPMNGRIRTYASEYVRHGMIRFVSGQYSRAVRHGGMLGYVLDSKVQAAINSIATIVQRQCTLLGMDPPGKLQLSSKVPLSWIVADRVDARETHHRRKHDSAFFLIHHLFVPSWARRAKRSTTPRRPRASE
ncbi:MAG: hypothetical protein ABIG44_09365 [Planctomycetota bacterium]